MSKKESELKIKQMKNGTVNKATLEGIVIEDQEFGNNDAFELTGANMKYATIKNVGMGSANLNDIDLSESELYDVDFSSSKLNSAKFVKSDLSEIMFPGSMIQDADFTNATLSNVIFFDMESFKPEQQMNLGKFTGAILKGVSLFNIYDIHVDYVKKMFSPEQLKEIQFLIVPKYDYNQNNNNDGSDEEEDDYDEYRASPSPSTNTSPNSNDVPWKIGAKSSKVDCPSDGLAPTRDCANKKKQWLVFHPDKNPGCEATSTKKMKVLNNYCQ
jgi:hypothetical protein